MPPAGWEGGDGPQAGGTGTEDLQPTLHAERAAEVMPGRPSLRAPAAVSRPEAVEDYVRNFLQNMGLARTLGTFQQEWYARVQEGLIKEDDPRTVPDV